MAEVAERTVDGDIWLIAGGSSRSQVTLGWEDCCGGNGGGPACFYIREGDTPATGTSVEPNADDQFPLATDSRRSVIPMTLISVLYFLF